FVVDAAAIELYQQSDLLLAVGTRFRGNETRNWQLPLPSPRIQIDVDPSLLGRNYPIDVGIGADARLTLLALLESVSDSPDPAWLTRVAEAGRPERARFRVILFNDGGYGILRNLQDTDFDGRRFGVDLTTPDFLRLADSFGVWSGQIRSAVETAPVLKEALQQEGPALVEVDMQAVGPMAIPFTGSARLVPGRS